MSEDAYPARRSPGSSAGGPGIRVHVYFLDQDPLLFAEDLLARRNTWEPPEEIDVETPLFTSVLRTIVPWEWDWFDRS